MKIHTTRLKVIFFFHMYKYNSVTFYCHIIIITLAAALGNQTDKLLHPTKVDVESWSWQLIKKSVSKVNVTVDE